MFDCLQPWYRYSDIVDFYDRFFNKIGNAMTRDENEKVKQKMKIVWLNVIMLGYFHVGALYGLYLAITGHVKLYTIIWGMLLGFISNVSVTGGAHRLWSHRSYKANLALRIFWATLMCMTFQNHIYEWARDHRVHHKYSETDADPHNSKRGFFFSHVGWLMVRKHKDVIEKGKNIDMSDLEQDGVVMFQKKYYLPLVAFGTFILPALVPWYFWNEAFLVSFYVASILRYIIGVNLTWCINSAAHLYGRKPYDKNIGPTQNSVMKYLALGEGFHNYHHTFPWDYKAAEFGNDHRNFTTSLIDFFAKIGWANELKTASPEMIRKRALRTGDGSWTEDLTDLKRNFPANVYTDREKIVWGWGDEAMSIKEKNDIKNKNNIMK